MNCSYDEAKEMVIEKNWEGLVLYDVDYVLTYRTDGKAPARPKGCYKWKPIHEDDFIVRKKIFRPGTRVVREVVLAQIDPITGKEFDCGKLGSFTDEMRKKLARVKLPFVVQVGFEARFPKSGKLSSARFMEVRTDKPVEHCIAPRSFREKILGYCKECGMNNFYCDEGGWVCEKCGQWFDHVLQPEED